MTNYYDLPPPERKRPSIWWLVLLLLLLFLLGLWATWWSLRLRPGEMGEAPVMTAAALPAPQVVLSELPPEPAPLPEPVSDTPAEPVSAGPEPVAEPEAEPAPLFSDARWRETARFTGTDEAGRRAEFTAYVLVGDETWTFARADSIFSAGLNAPVETAFSKLDLGEGICSLSRVIAVGAASVEGTAAQNTYLSRARGGALNAAIAANLPCGQTGVPTSTLDLGYSTQKVTCPAGQPICPEMTAPQRPIAMILAASDDPDTDIGEALKEGITAHEANGADVFPGVRVSDYSAFQSAFDLL